MDCLTVLKAGCSNSRCWQGWFLPKAVRKNLFQSSLVVSRSLRHFLACKWHSLGVFTWSCLCVRLCVQTFLLFKKNIYLFFVQAFSTCSEQGLLFLLVLGLLIAVASHYRAQALGTWASELQYLGSVVVAHGLSFPAACGIFPDQGSNLCPLHLQVDSNMLHHLSEKKSVR